MFKTKTIYIIWICLKHLPFFFFSLFLIQIVAYSHFSCTTCFVGGWRIACLHICVHVLFIIADLRLTGGSTTFSGALVLNTFLTFLELNWLATGRCLTPILSIYSHCLPYPLCKTILHYPDQVLNPSIYLDCILHPKPLIPLHHALSICGLQHDVPLPLLWFCVSMTTTSALKISFCISKRCAPNALDFVIVRGLLLGMKWNGIYKMLDNCACVYNCIYTFPDGLCNLSSYMIDSYFAFWPT